MYKITQIGRFEAMFSCIIGNVCAGGNWDEQNEMLAHGWKGEHVDGV